tara:strand:- start:514 stop:831 length:318 start_codon:yes stop_codon:yes gene_type:complete
MFSVTVYSTGESCQRCRLTILRLEAKSVRFTVVNVADEANAAAREFVTNDLGYTEAPVVVVDEEPQHHWSGFRPDLIDQLANPYGSPGAAPQPVSTAATALVIGR